MTLLYIIKDRTDSNFYKPFVGIYKDENKVKQIVANMKSRLSLASQNLISYQPVHVQDFDPNKSQIFVVFDKTDRSAKKDFVSMHFDFQNAEKQIKSLKQGLNLHSQKLVYARPERVE